MYSVGAVNKDLTRTYRYDDLYFYFKDYFGYEVQLAMNITDIDDKIILRYVCV